MHAFTLAATWFGAMQIASAQFGFFQQMMQQQKQQQQQQRSDQHAQRQAQEGMTFLEYNYYRADCPQYLCPDTLACVNEPVDCPCPFENSQLKCVLPDKKNYVCISKPSTEDGPDCDSVLRAYKGKI